MTDNFYEAINAAENQAKNSNGTFFVSKTINGNYISHDDPKIDGEIIATIIRKSPNKIGKIQNLQQATEFVMKNLPDDIHLSDQVIIERFPSVQRYGVTPHLGGIFSYQFMTQERLNIATWIPNMASVSLGPTMLTGFEGRGRQYANEETSEKVSIRDFINLVEGRDFFRNYPNQDAFIYDVYKLDSAAQDAFLKVYKDIFTDSDFTDETIKQMANNFPEPLIDDASYDVSYDDSKDRDGLNSHRHIG